ncbi:cyanophycinase [Clostridium sp.]|uniref:cyanophycinase n=1 Tax=Clostridium sp. TaxID=1506 RepID=UPI0034638994
MKDIVEGKLIIIGGAEDKEGSKEILKVVCQSINKENDFLVIATIATENPEEAGKKYTEIFNNLGVKNISILDVKERNEAHNEENINMLRKAALVFFTGGDQLRITSILGGTPLHEEIKQSYTRGCIYVGTSAGASVMSSTMIVNGIDEESPKKCTLKMAPGLDLIDGVIIDQHFAQRGRIGRLLVGIAENPGTLGIGIDEDTAIIVDNKGVFNVIGSGAVYVIDGCNISYSNVSEQYQEELLSMFDVKMHVLKEGNGFNLLTRRPLEEEGYNNENK